MFRRFPAGGKWLMGLVKKPSSEIIVNHAEETLQNNPTSMEMLKKKRTIDFFKSKNVQEVTFDPEKMKQLKAELEETKKHSVY